MEDVLNFIKANPAQSIMILLLFLIFVVYFIWRIKKKGLRPFIIEFIVRAEETFKQGENEEKMNYVIDKIITLIPLPFSLFITREMVRNIIQKVFDEIKSALDCEANIPIVTPEEVGITVEEDKENK